MRISEVFLALGEDTFLELLRQISIGKLKTFQVYERFKVRAHLNKLNAESLRKAQPKFWARLQEGDDDFATDLSQVALISHLDMIKAILDFLKIPHEEGFFAKDLDPEKYLTDDWQKRVFEEFQDRFSKPVLLFYINHLDWELAKPEKVFLPAA